MTPIAFKNHDQTPVFNFVSLTTWTPTVLLTLLVLVFANSSASAQYITVDPQVVCVGNPVYISVSTTCQNESGGLPTAWVDSTEVELGWDGNGWSGTYYATTAGQPTVWAADDCDDAFNQVTLTVVQLEGIFFVNAATDIDGYNYATLKAASGNVTITATLTPDNATAATVLQWEGATPIGDNRSATVSKTAAVHDHVSACLTCAESCASVDIWVISALLKSIEFTSDHHVMTTNNSDWTDTGIPYGKPEWVADSSHSPFPISQTKGTTVSIKAKVNVQPSGLPFNITGTGSSTFLSFPKANSTSTGSDQEIPMTSSGSLPSSVGVLSSDWTSWSIDAFGGAFGEVFHCATESSAHKIYVTYGTPIVTDNVPTERRIRFVCENASGYSSLGACADAIVDHLSGSYDLNGPVSGPDPVWLLHDGNHASQCPGLAIYINKHFEMLGLGSGTIEYCHPNTNGTYGTSTPPIQIRDCTPGNNGHPSPTTHDDVATQEFLCIWDGSQPPGPNVFEATCLFNGTYYALANGNVCKKSTPKEVVYWAFGNPPNIHWVYATSATAVTDCQYNAWTEAP